MMQRLIVTPWYAKLELFDRRIEENLQSTGLIGVSGRKQPFDFKSVSLNKIKYLVFPYCN